MIERAASVKPRLRRGIYLVTDPGLSMQRVGLPGAADATDRSWHVRAIAETAQLVRAVAGCGLDAIQLRWKNVDAGYFMELGAAVASALATANMAESEKRPLLIVNDRVDVYLALRNAGVPVDGVHLGQTDLPVRAARELIGPDAHLGWSAASQTEIAAANEQADLIDAIGVGVLRATETKTNAPAPLGFAGMAQATNTAKLPVIAIGGIKAADVYRLSHSCNVHSVAVVSAIVSAADPVSAASALVEQFDRGQQARD